MKNTIPKYIPAFLEYFNVTNKQIEKFFEYEGIFYKNPRVSLWQKLNPEHETGFNYREHQVLQRMKKELENKQRAKALIYKRDNMLDNEFLREHKIIKDHARQRAANNK